MKLIEKIKQKKIRSAVIGLGYVGLPLAVELAEAGIKVIGIDLDKTKVAALNNKKSYIADVPAERLKKLVAKGMLSATSDYSVLKDVDTINICVPTPLRKTKEPDISYIVRAAEQIARTIHRGRLLF